MRKKSTQGSAYQKQHKGAFRSLGKVWKSAAHTTQPQVSIYKSIVYLILLYISKNKAIQTNAKCKSSYKNLIGVI